MYYEHFGLSGAPFEFNPSASVLFMSAGHREGLAALEWGLREPSGFTMLVGEIGAGKTTLIYSLLAARHREFAAHGWRIRASASTRCCVRSSASSA